MLTPANFDETPLPADVELRCDFSSGVDSEPPTGLPYKTKFDAAIYGMKGFCLAALATLILTFLLTSSNSTTNPISKDIFPFGPQSLYGVFYIALFPSVLFGASVGYSTHQLATGDRIFIITPWWQWLLMMLLAMVCCFIIPIIVCFWFQSNLRKRVLLFRCPISNLAPVTYASLGLVIAMLSFQDNRLDNYALRFTIILVPLYCAADCLIVKRIALWGHAHQLAPRNAKFQFTLGHMMVGIFIFAAYLTGFLKLIGAI